MDALVLLQRALDDGDVRMSPCELHPDLAVIRDEPNGVMRITYAVVSNGKVQVVVLFVLTDPIDGHPCLQLGCAVLEARRGKGLATQTVSKAIQELRNGLSRNGVQRFYIEAIVSTENTPSNKLAHRLLSDSPETGTDNLSGHPILQYSRLIV